METKETVKLINGEEKDITIKYIGSRTADVILDKHLKVNSIKNTEDGNEVDIQGTSLFKIKREFMDKGLGDFDYDMLSPEESNRIFQKYYQKVMTDAMSFVSGNPKS